MATTTKNWYVLRAVSGKEAKVKEYIDAELKHNALLQKHVFQVLLPMEKHASLRNGKRVTTLFHGVYKLLECFRTRKFKICIAKIIVFLL